MGGSSCAPDRPPKARASRAAIAASARVGSGFEFGPSTSAPRHQARDHAPTTTTISDQRNGTTHDSYVYEHRTCTTTPLLLYYDEVHHPISNCTKIISKNQCNGRGRIGTSSSSSDQGHRCCGWSSSACASPWQRGHGVGWSSMVRDR